MKKNILKSFSALAVIIMAASCETLDYNEKNFGDLGYESDPEITDVQVLEITLSADDYSTIAGLYDNTSMADAAGLSDELSAVGTNGYFSEAISGSDYIPAYLESIYDSYLSVGSKIKVTYDTVAGESAELAAIMAGEAYTVSADDYATVWGEVSASYFTPSVTAASNLPTILAAALPDAVEGDYALVTYAYSDSEPSTGGTEEPEVEDSVDNVLVATFDGSELPTAYAENETITVAGYDFVANYVANYGGTGPIQFKSSVSYLYNTAPISNMSQLVITLANSYNNFTVYAGTEANPLTTAVEAVTEDLVVTYTLPAGTTYITICNEATYTAYANQFDIYTGEAAEASIYDAIADVEVGTACTVQGTVVAKATNAFIISDSSASIYVYGGADNHSIGDVIILEGTPSTYNSGLQFAYSSSTVTADGTKSFSYPTAGTVDSSTIGDFTTGTLFATYVECTGTLTEDGSYADVTIDGIDYTVCIYYATSDFDLTSNVGSEITISGYVYAYSSYYSCLSFMVTSLSSASSAPAKASAVTSTCNVVYYFNGSAWSAADDTVMLTSADYTAMGSTYGNLSGTQNETLVPIYLANNYPYAVEGDEMVVVYKYYSSSVTAYKASTYTKGAADWTMVGDIETVVGAPFEKKSSGWMYDPSMTISIGTTDSDNIALYFPTMLSYVKSKYGSEYIDSYGTSEYYSGSASYYGNINWRYSYVLGYWATAGIDCSPYYTHTNGSDGLVAMYDVLKANLAETLAYALSVHNSDANAVDGMEVLYTVQFGLYYGPTISGTNAEMIFEVVGPAEFEFVELNFLDDSADVYSEDNLSYVISTYGTYYQ